MAPPKARDDCLSCEFLFSSPQTEEEVGSCLSPRSGSAPWDIFSTFGSLLPLHAIASLPFSTLENCRVRPKHLSAYANPDTRDRHMPVDVVLDLEAAARDPVVTRCLAAQQGYVLFRLPAVRACRIWDRHQRRVVREGSIVFARLTEVLEDGRISKQEAGELRVEVDQALAAFAGLRSSLDKRLERPDPP